MAVDLTIEMDNTAGELGRLGTALGDAGVNLLGLCAVAGGGPTAHVHLLIEEAEPAYRALTAAGIPIDVDQEVLIVEVDDRPGAMGEIARRLGEAGINIDLIYMATANRLVIGADDLHAARTTLS